MGTTPIIIVYIAFCFYSCGKLAFRKISLQNLRKKRSHLFLVKPKIILSCEFLSQVKHGYGVFSALGFNISPKSRSHEEFQPNDSRWRRNLGQPETEVSFSVITEKILTEVSLHSICFIKIKVIFYYQMSFTWPKIMIPLVS